MSSLAAPFIESPKALVIVAAVLTAAAFWAILTFAGSANERTGSVSSPKALRSMSPQDHRYVKGVVALRPAQQRAAYSSAARP